jgi:hypothetical protein
MSLLPASSGYEDVGLDEPQLAAAETLAAVPGCRYERALMAEDLEAGSWGRIRSAFGELDCFVLSRPKRGWFGWRQSFEIVVAAVFEFEAGVDFGYMLGRLVRGL